MLGVSQASQLKACARVLTERPAVLEWASFVAHIFPWKLPSTFSLKHDILK